MSDGKEWVTVKTPKEDRDKASDYKPDGATWGDCLVAGAERLNEHLDSDPQRFDSSAEVELTFYDGQIDALSERLEAAVGGSGVSYDDVKAACQAAIEDELVDEVRRS